MAYKKEFYVVEWRGREYGEFKKESEIRKAMVDAGWVPIHDGHGIKGYRLGRRKDLAVILKWSIDRMPFSSLPKPKKKTPGTI